MADLTHEDLILMMEQYKNVIELNTILHEEQKNILNQQHLLYEKVKEHCRDFDKSNDRDEKHDEFLHSLDKMVSEKFLLVDKEMTTINKKLFYIGTAVGTVVVSLVALLYELVKNMQALDAITKHLGL